MSYHVAMKTIQQQIELVRKNQINQLQDALSFSLLELEWLTKYLANDQLLTANLLEHPYYAKEGKASLLTYKTSHQLIREVYLYYANEQPNMLFSSGGKYSLETFLTKKATDNVLTQHNFVEQLATKSPKLIAVNEKAVNKLNTRFFYLVPLREENNWRDLLAIYEINRFDFTHSQSFSSDNLVNDNDEMKQLSHILTVAENINDENQLIDQLAFTNEKKVSGSLIAIEDEQKFLGVQQKFFWLFSFALAISFSAILILSFLYFRPIKEIENFVQSLNMSEPYSFSDLQQTLKGFLKDYQILHKKNQKQIPYVREKIFRCLLNDECLNEMAIHGLLDTIVGDFQARAYFILTIDFMQTNDDDSYSQSLETIKKEYQASLMEQTVCGGIIRSVYLVGIKEGTQQTQVVHSMMRNVAYRSKENMTIGVGSIVENLHSIHTSYLTSLTALHHKTETNHLILYSDISNEEIKQVIDYSDGQILKLTNCLKNGDKTGALLTIDYLISAYLFKMDSLNIQRIYGYHLLHTIIQIGTELRGQEFLKEVGKYPPFLNLLQLEDQLNELIEHICRKINRSVKKEQGEVDQAIINYMDEQFQSAQLSLALIAEEFRVSPSYISRMLRKETGQSFSKYIQEKRFKKIKQDLIETDLPIKDIIRKNGYYDTSNFTRKFRIIVGMTPGEYRKIKRNG